MTFADMTQPSRWNEDTRFILGIVFTALLAGVGAGGASLLAVGRYAQANEDHFVAVERSIVDLKVNEEIARQVVYHALQDRIASDKATTQPRIDKLEAKMDTAIVGVAVLTQQMSDTRNLVQRQNVDIRATREAVAPSP